MIAAMAGVLFPVARGLVDFTTIRQVLPASKLETPVPAVALFSAIFLEFEFAIFTCVLLVLVLHPDSQSRPRIVTRAPDPRLSNRAFSSDPDRPECSQVRFLRIDGSQSFGAVNHVRRAFDRLPAGHPGNKHPALIAEGRNFVDLPGPRH